MISFTLFGYRINIRKVRQLNPRDCRGYKAKCDENKRITTAHLKARFGK